MRGSNGVSAVALCLLLGWSASLASSEPDDRERRLLERTSDAALEAHVDTLLAAMTLEEKIGQMTMVNIAEPSSGIHDDGVWDPTRPPAVSPERIETVLGRYQVGALMTDAPLAPAAWAEFVGGLQREAMARSSQGIPMIYAVCHMHGAGYMVGATVFPHNINLAATFDPGFAHDAAAVTALETADLGHHWLYTPVVDIGRDPRWGRFYETAGESPLLGAALARAIVGGVQDHPETAPYRIVASAKHFIGYSDPRTGYDRSPALIPDQALYEYWVPAFQAAIDAGVGIIETNSGEVNGVPVHASRRLLTTLLRDEMGFRGVLNTDWADVAKLVSLHRVAENEKQAALLAIEAGNDLVLTGFDTAICDHLAELVREGRLSLDRIDLSVSRILRLKLQFGLFDNPLPRTDRFDRIGRPESRARALEAARESLVLLRNEGDVLPLGPKDVRALVVTGPLADSRTSLAGGWTLSWSRPTEEMMPAEMPSVLRALRDRYGSGRIWHRTTSDGVRWLAPEADAIVFVAGEEPYAEFKGSVDDLSLPADQIAGIETALATGRPVVLVMVGGRPRIITRVFDRCAAVLWAGLPGFEGGTAISDVIAGFVNPSGKLPFAYPASPSRLVNYDHKPSLDSETAPRSRWTVADFGSGLSYTTFGYDALSLSQEALTGQTDSLTASVRVTNTGSRPGREAVLWFLSDEVGSISRPVRQLAHFEKITLEPGEARTVRYRIEPGRDLSFPDATGAPLLEPGWFRLVVGGEELRFRYDAAGG
jgi:beta-glucosidase